MGIKEALGREPIGEQWRSIERRGMRSEPSSSRQEVLKQGRNILREARIPKLFEELAEIIKPRFPDVIIEEGMDGDLGIFLNISWDFQKKEELGPGRYGYKRVAATAYPITGNLVIEGRDGELLETHKWRPERLEMASRQEVEDAIVRAYREPGTCLGPPRLVV